MAKFIRLQGTHVNVDEILTVEDQHHGSRYGARIRFKGGEELLCTEYPSEIMKKIDEAAA